MLPESRWPEQGDLERIRHIRSDLFGSPTNMPTRLETGTSTWILMLATSFDNLPAGTRERHLSFKDGRAELHRWFEKSTSSTRNRSNKTSAHMRLQLDFLWMPSITQRHRGVW